MTLWNDIRRKARQQRAVVLPNTSGVVSASALLEAAARITGILYLPVPAGDPLLDGGEAVLDIEAGVIWFNQDIEPELAVFYIAHEYAHFWLHGGHTTCTAGDVEPEVVEERVPLRVDRVEGYSPQERQEREANVYAREFLLARDDLRTWFIVDGMDAAAIATRAGLPIGMVLHHLSLALLTPRIEEDAASERHIEGAIELDASQQEAAYVSRCPLLLEAGPGTGKTRTLVGRTAFLLGHGVPASSILALTFSNKAAEEMRARIARVAPDAALQMWMGTFHAFGLELLRKYGARLGLPLRLSVLDPVDALFLLERALPSLNLEYYQNLYEPTTYLGDILSAISRAKDELVGPAQYTSLAEQMLARATIPDEVEAANKALEVARVYTFYQQHLDQEHLLDFGDLIFKAVVLLRTHNDIRAEVQQTYTHVLVDEYQDVNRASGFLLREVAGAGQGLWVVGDARQSIYRWRGAAPINMRLFATDFPGATIQSLQRNYRSQPAVLNVVAALAPRMRASSGSSFTPWEPARTDAGGKVLMEIADDQLAEAEGLAREIERQRAAGIPYRDQAVLCRSHTGLARVAASLEQAGIPVLYLGDLFERPEIRDLLSLVSLACEGHGSGLVRVARFAEYQIPLTDVRTLLDLAREHQVPFPRALKLAQDADTISEAGKQGLALLDHHLDGLCYGSNAWGMLVRYLFTRSAYLRPLLTDDSVAGQQRKLAIFQFLQFAHEQRSGSQEDDRDPKRAFLRYVRRLEKFGEEKQLRQVPDWAMGIDAVQLLTIHASKGMEFRAVYVPGLGKGLFPAKRQWRPCPPPASMLPERVDDARDEEEECLFFVALSRARDVLCLSRARRYGSQNSNPSGLLDLIARALPYPAAGASTWKSSEIVPVPPVVAPAVPIIDAGTDTVPCYDADILDVYIRCPRQFYYEYILGLTGKRDVSAYVRFHRCVCSVLHWLQDEGAQGQIVDDAMAQARLAEIWEARGPRNHPYEQIYRRSAEIMVARAVTRPPTSWGPAARPTWEVPLRSGRVRLSPDHVEIAEQNGHPTVKVRRLRTGRPSKREQEKDIYALYHVAAMQAYPDASREIELIYLATDEVRDADLSRQMIQTRLERYEAAIAGILREVFPAQPDDRECPACPFYFICPLAEDV